MKLSEVQVFVTPWRWHRGVKTCRSEHYIKRKYCVHLVVIKTIYTCTVHALK